MYAWLLRELPDDWAWVRRACGGHWEIRVWQEPPFGPPEKVKRYVWWKQFEDCQYRTGPPFHPCEEHGPVKVWVGDPALQR